MKKVFFYVLVMTTLCATVFTGCKDDEDTELKRITLSETSKMLKPEETFKLSVEFFSRSTPYKEVTWSSNNNAVATVAEDGTVTAHGEGNATITVTSKHNASISATCAVEVTTEVFETMKGAVSGVWPAHSTVYITDQIWVEQGKSLTVEQGVTIIVQDGEVGASRAPIEFFVEGSLYLKGTEAYPILVTVASSKRTEEYKYAGLWGGFVRGDNFSELLFDHVIVEYTGGLCRANSQSVLAGLNVADKDRTAQILTNNPNGKIVIMNSTFRYAESDALYFMGGKAIVANNIIHTIGETDNDGINMKAGVQVDIAYNLTFSVNSNGMKLSSSGESPERHQALIRAYNNTIVNSGWRRTKNLKGGSIFLEQNALGSVYNNLVLNCKLLGKTPNLNNPSSNKGGAHWESILDYNFYASGSQTLNNPALRVVEGAEILTAFAGYTHDDADYWHDGRLGTPIMDGNSLIATAPGALDPGFVNFGFNTVALDDDGYSFEKRGYDFHVTSASSPVVAGANGKTPRSDFSGKFAPYFANAPFMVVDGKEYKSPVPSARYGAFGTK